MIDKDRLKIVFFGTPLFAAHTLRAIHGNGYHVAAVVTAPDKAAGRGYKLQASEVKTAALELGIPLLQPVNLKSEDFLEKLRSFNADLQIVIAFRMLPKSVWEMPPLGTFNLHASLLPAYRGAAPINRAIMNGETETGVSTFFLKHEIDTGNIILQQKVKIDDNDNAGSLHNKLMEAGADLVIETLDRICAGNYILQVQEEGEFPHAPKIFTDDCRIDWHKEARQVHNLVRGLAPYPAAFTEYMDKKLKVFETEITEEVSDSPGKIEIRGKDLLLAHCADRLIKLKEVQPEGKKRMSARDFINGLHLSS